MCGIVGVFNYQKSEPVKFDQLCTMRDAISYRGPDDRGIWISPDRSLGLGHRRLAIIDLSRQAVQPMCNSDQSIWLVFNGIIYNHVSLRKELMVLGCSFKTRNSDTEVIINAYQTWGINCVQKLSGMFAFAVWDNRKKKLVLYRDRVGIKPLYFTRCSGTFLFASEIGAFFTHPDVNREIKPESVYHYLTFLTVPAPDTMFNGIYKVEAGTLLQIDKDGRISKTRYWDAANYLNHIVEQPESVVLEKSRELLQHAVESRIISDVPCSTTLSGGVDSTLINTYLKEKQHNFYSLTVDYTVKSDFSEGALAGEIARVLQLKNHYIYETTNDIFFMALDRYTKMQNDYPAGAQDIILIYLLTEYLQQKGIKVCLFGEGADELGGYPTYLTMQEEYFQLSEYINIADSQKRAKSMAAFFNRRGLSNIFYEQSIISRKHIQAFSEEEKVKMWIHRPVDNSYRFIKKIMDEITVPGEDNFLRKVTNVEFKLRLPEFMLPRIDYPSMRNAIEARVPFLDHELVEYHLSLPMQSKMKHNHVKYIFKKLLSEHIDSSYLSQKKIGFGRVLTPLLQTVLIKWCNQEIFSRKNSILFNYINKNYFKKIYQQSHYGNNSFKLWTLYALHKWLEQNC